MSSLLGRLPGHIILFTGIMIGGVACLFIYLNHTNLLSWAALLYGVFSVFIGVSAIRR